MTIFVDVCGKELGKVPEARVMGGELREKVRAFAPGCRKLFTDGEECLDGAELGSGTVVVVSPRIFRPASEWGKSSLSPSFWDDMRYCPPHMLPEWLFCDVLAVRTKQNTILPHWPCTINPFFLCRQHGRFHDLVFSDEKLAAFPVGVFKQYNIVVGVFINKGVTTLGISDIKIK